MTTGQPPVGFIGLGQIGGPMARRLSDWPGGLTVYDVVPEATERFARKGATVASSPAALAEHALVISVMVRDDAQVHDVMCGPDGILSTARAGTVVVIHSTVEADTPARLAEIATAQRVHVVDAPVSGGAIGAHDGTLALMVGGSDEAVALARGPLERLGTLVAHLGPVGAGTRAKLARNLITFASFAAVGEASRLAEAAGVDLALLGEVVRHSDRITGGPGSVMLRPTAAPLSPDDGLHDIFVHTCGLGEKDLGLAIDLGESLGLDMAVAHLAVERLASALGIEHPPSVSDRDPDPEVDR
ncbi:MAG: NAD(P)-dependent oxidoreductase [Microthrixaceae bacterium]|jgi:3-hydroxyisobutyrate dehydrogenase|nr:NAD(P)-dependent oxidoreductase [Microthrixaceae bacterium]